MKKNNKTKLLNEVNHKTNMSVYLIVIETYFFKKNILWIIVFLFYLGLKEELNFFMRT